MSNGPAEQRGISPVAGAGRSPVYKKAAAGTIIVVMAGAVGFALWRNANPPEEIVREKLPASLGAVGSYTPPVMVVPRQPPAPAPAPAPLTPAAFTPPPMPPWPYRAPAAQQTDQAPPSVPASPRVAVTAPVRPKPYMLTYAAPPPVSKPAEPPAAPAEGSGSKVAYTASVVDGVKAGLLGDLTFKLMPGLLACVMDTSIDSTFEGPVQCHVPFDIRPQGVTLLGRGSIVHGWYHNQIRTGQSRVFVQADWVHDPATGCFITFKNAPIADSIGKAGIEGSVDPHNWQRFGAAMLLTLGQTGENIAQAALSKSGNGSNNGNSYFSFGGGGGGNNGMEQIATTILREQIRIPPTITVNEGSAIAVFVTQVLDFSDCYNIKVK